MHDIVASRVLVPLTIITSIFGSVVVLGRVIYNYSCQLTKQEDDVQLIIPLQRANKTSCKTYFINALGFLSRSRVRITSLFLMIVPAVEFWTYLIFNIFSFLCSLFLIYHLVFDRVLRQALSNHIIIILLLLGLVYEVTYIPWHLYRLIHGTPWILSPTFYLVSYFCDYVISTSQTILFTWATIERHILIFHDKWISTKKKRILVHYLPIAALLIYTVVFYSIITFGPFCEKSFVLFLMVDYYLPCVLSKTALGTFDVLLHQVTPTLLIVISSLALLIRAVQQKQRVNQPIRWRQHRKMTIQLLSISVLYLFFNLPWMIIIFGLQYGLQLDAQRTPLLYVGYFRPYIIFFFPFVCCGSLSELRKKVKKIFLCCPRQHRITTEEPMEMIGTLRQRTARH